AMEQQDEQKEKRRERTESMTEESFLKDIYFFMKQRDTPIERIPHLGFKQINLYMMFKAVMELGGYHQVNINSFIQHNNNKNYFMKKGNYSGLVDVIRVSLKRHRVSLRRHRVSLRHHRVSLRRHRVSLRRHRVSLRHHSVSLTHHRVSLRHHRVSLRRHRVSLRHQSQSQTSQSQSQTSESVSDFTETYLPPGPISLPSYLAVSLPSIPPLSSPVHARPMMPYVPLPSAPPAQKGNVEQSLEYLRHLAQEFKSSSGWTEPLNLSKNQGSLETSRNIPSSFTSPSTKKKEPKFLNEAPRLQQGNHPNLWKVAPKSPPSSTPSSSPSHRPPPPHHLPHPPPPPPHLLHPHPPPPPHLLPPPPPPPPSHLPPQRPNYPCTVQAKLTTQQSVQVPVSKSGSSTTSPMNPGPTNSTYPSDPYGGMEIQIPLSLLQNLIKEGLILNTASHQHHQPNPKPNETPSVPERTTAETNPDQPADLSLKNQTRN
ncbi:AT-rich interaction domain 6, partial [Silurus asotus]